MNLSWIDPYIDGVIEYCDSNDIYEMYKTLDINLKCIDKDVERQPFFEQIHSEQRFTV